MGRSKEGRTDASVQGKGGSSGTPKKNVKRRQLRSKVKATIKVLGIVMCLESHEKEKLLMAVKKHKDHEFYIWLSKVPKRDEQIAWASVMVGREVVN